jgi:hypothetical protein
MKMITGTNAKLVGVKIILTIEEDEFGDLNSELVAEDIGILEALEIIKDAQEELYISRINLN